MNQENIFDRLIELSRECLDRKDMPIASIITDPNGNILSQGSNKMKSSQNETAHAEIEAIRNAKLLVDKRQNPQDLIIYTTLEPCPACGFFISQTNIKRIIVLASDPMNSLTQLISESDYYSKLYKDIVIEIEPSKDYKIQSLKLLIDYFEIKGKLEVANIFKNKL